MSAPTPDPYELLLCQIAGLQAAQVLRLLAQWHTAEAVLRAPSEALRAAGLAPAIVAKIVGGSRQVATVSAGLKGLQRLGITPVPLIAASYPTRLRESTNPPLVIYVQGRWPIQPPSVVLIGQPATPETQDAARAWLTQLGSMAITCAASESTLELAPPAHSLAVVPYGLILARQRLAAPLRQAVQQGHATLVSATAVNLPPDDRTQALARTLLATLADAQLLLDPAATPLTSTLPTFILRLAPLEPTAAPGIKRLQPNTRGLCQLAKTLGIHTTATATVQQERLL